MGSILKYILTGLALICLNNANAQSTSQWSYFYDQSDLSACQPKLIVSDSDDHLLFSCVFESYWSWGQLFIAEFNRTNGSAINLDSIFHPYYTFDYMYGITQIDRTRIIAGSYYVNEVFGIDVDDTLKPIDLHHLSISAQGPKDIAQIGEKVFVAGVTDLGQCILEIHADGTSDHNCIPNPDWLEPQVIKANRDHVYVGLANGTHELALVKYDTSGNDLWFSTFYGGYGSMPSECSDIQFMDNGDVIIIGRNNEHILTGYDIVVVCYDNDTGEEKWNYTYSYNSDLWGDGFRHAFIDNQNTLHLLGSEEVGQIYNDLFFLSIDSSGTLINSKIIPNPGYLIMDVTSFGDNYLLWGFRKFNDTPLMVFDKSGMLLSEYNYTDIDAYSLHRGFQIEYISHNEIYLFAKEDHEDIFLARVGIPISGFDQPDPVKFKIFPNPATDHINIQCDDCYGAIIQILDLTGRVLHRQSYTLAINLEGILNAGIYYIVLETADGFKASSPVVFIN